MNCSWASQNATSPGLPGRVKYGGEATQGVYGCHEGLSGSTWKHTGQRIPRKARQTSGSTWLQRHSWKTFSKVWKKPVGGSSWMTYAPQRAKGSKKKNCLSTRKPIHQTIKSLMNNLIYCLFLFFAWLNFCYVNKGSFIEIEFCQSHFI